MAKRKLDIIEDSDDDSTEVLIGEPTESESPTTLAREAKKKLLDNPTWEKKKTRAPPAAKKKAKKVTKKTKSVDKPDNGKEEANNIRASVAQSRPRRYPAAKLNASDEDDADVEQFKLRQTEASRAKTRSQEPASARGVKPTHATAPTLASDIFNDAMAAELDTVEESPQEAAEKAEIERDREAEMYESDDVEFNKLDEAAMASQLEQERGSWADDDKLPDIPQSRSASRTSIASSGIIFDDEDDTEIRDEEDHELTAGLQEAYHHYQKLKAAAAKGTTVNGANANRTAMKGTNVKGVAAKGATANGTAAARTTANLKVLGVPAPTKISLSATKPKKPTGVRQQKHEKERPEWVADDILDTPIHAPSARVMPLNVRSQPELEVKLEGGIPPLPRYAGWTSLVIDAENPSTLLLTSQHPDVKKVVQHSLIFFWAFFCWTNTYPDSASLIEYMRKSLLKAAKHLKLDDMIDRLSTDTDYVRELSTILNGRVSAWRVKPKANAVATITAGYGLANNNKLRTGAWIGDKAYIYKGNVAEGSKKHTLDAARPYENPTILSVLEEVFFTGNTSIGARLPSKFKSSSSDKPNEKEVPIPMLAHVATSVYAGLKEREHGARVPADFDSGVFENTYRRHVDFLESIRRDGPTKFHAMMHRIYTKVSCGQSKVASDGEEFSSFFDLSKMADE